MDEQHAPTRAAALARLVDFAPRMGRAYAEGRNTDPGPGARRDVSLLSPYLRHRLLTESEAIGTALAEHGAEGAQIFVQEVFWRSYWKGWLQLHPSVWDDYVARVAADHARLRTEGGLRRAFETAATGATGIAAFDAWAHELVNHGWLHNHARMWFASIWCFTLRLPWTLGADLFLRHLKDGDAASNTLSWRWVIGSQTRGKHYVATAQNIARFTAGRFAPQGELDEAPEPILEAEPPPAVPLVRPDPPPTGRVALLLHEDDLGVESLDLGGATVVAVAGLAMPAARSPAGCSPVVAAFTGGALADALGRAAARFGVVAERLAADDLPAWAARCGATPIVTPEAPVGWTDDALVASGVRLHRLRREWDAACWPLATRGFFPFRKRIPELLRRLDPRPPGAA